MSEKAKKAQDVLVSGKKIYRKELIISIICHLNRKKKRICGERK